MVLRFATQHLIAPLIFAFGAGLSVGGLMAAGDFRKGHGLAVSLVGIIAFVGFLILYIITHNPVAGGG